MNFLEISLFLSVLFCALATGFILTYSIVVMPGLSKLDDKAFIKAFQVTDRIIQNNQPIFILIWLGLIISVFSTIIVSIFSLGILEAWLIIFTSVVYFLGVQVITITIHLPLNRRIQNIDINSTNSQTLSDESKNFKQNGIILIIFERVLLFLFFLFFF